MKFSSLPIGRMHWLTIVLLALRAIRDGYDAIANFIMIFNLVTVFGGEVEPRAVLGVAIPLLIVLSIILMFMIKNRAGLIIFSFALIIDTIIGVVSFDGWYKLMPLVGLALFYFVVMRLPKDGVHWYSYTDATD
ncbi:MAG: hypothetical protein IKR17_09755 [Bacteroidales bacterium]|nr:hypothetical protein [Bacteroidales bacterium]